MTWRLPEDMMQKIRLSKDVVFRDLSGEAVILNLTTGTYFGLNEVGTRMWALLAEHGSTDKVVQTLLKEFDVEEATLRADLDALLRQLRSKGLVRTDDK
jgi:hypothetical protein